MGDDRCFFASTPPSDEVQEGFIAGTIGAAYGAAYGIDDPLLPCFYDLITEILITGI